MEETYKNLAVAFIGESQARNRYTFYAKVAEKEGYKKVAEIFLLTAEQEREHAKHLFRLMNELRKKYGFKDPKVEAVSPVVLGNTIENLKSAIRGETYEYEEMYPSFADVAESEGLIDIAERLRAISIAEKNHKERFQKLLDEIEKGEVWEKQEEVVWVCRKCGYMHKGKTPPETCPSCSHPKEYFEVRC